MGPIHLYGQNVDNFKWLFLWSLRASVATRAEPPWAGEWKIAKMVMVHWSKWLPCPYTVKTFKNLLLHNPISPGSWVLIFAQITGDRRSTKIAQMMVLCWHLTFLPPRSNLLPYLCGPYTFILKVSTCRSTVVKIVLIGNLRWPSSGLYL